MEHGRRRRTPPGTGGGVSVWLVAQASILPVSIVGQDRKLCPFIGEVFGCRRLVAGSFFIGRNGRRLESYLRFAGNPPTGSKIGIILL
jgi:hypothetical protein